MLSETKLNILKSELKTCSREELLWFNGYLSGLLSHDEKQITERIPIPETAIKPTIIYGTETGNSKNLALQLHAVLKKNRIPSKVFDAGQYTGSNIEKEAFVVFIISTQGEGEPPANAMQLFRILSEDKLSLHGLRYAVLALGDPAYPLFCKAGEDLDLLLYNTGALRTLPLQKADTDYQETSDAWFNKLTEVLKNIQPPQTAGSNPGLEKEYNPKREYTGIVQHKIVLNDRGSRKETYHIEIDCKEEIHFEPGDAAGFYPYNSEHETRVVARLLKEEARFAELKRLNMKGLGKKQLEILSGILDAPIKEERSDLADILEKYGIPEKVGFNEVKNMLYPVSPRLYSISSSPEAHSGALHLTVGHHQFEANGTVKSGFCSRFLSDFPVNEPLTFYIHKNPHFRLPEQDRDLIMIGPGTGIAPFRSFLAHRDATGAEGRNWLFFGEQHFVSDFYYQTEIQQWLATGVLTKLDTAFSRDQKHKIYVQDRIKEQARELVSWIDNGASLYICGQKKPMSNDVEEALLQVISEVKGIHSSDAGNYLEQMKQQGRYNKDVY